MPPLRKNPLPPSSPSASWPKSCHHPQTQARSAGDLVGAAAPPEAAVAYPEAAAATLEALPEEGEALQALPFHLPPPPSRAVAAAEAAGGVGGVISQAEPRARWALPYLQQVKGEVGGEGGGWEAAGVGGEPHPPPQTMPETTAFALVLLLSLRLLAPRRVPLP